MEKHPITKYIEDSKNLGLSHEQIVQSLTNAGWRAHEILEIILDHKFTESPTVPIPNKDAMISVNGITKAYGKMKALDNVSLGVKEGSVTALLGPNGAGKTTLVRILATLHAADSGTAKVAGLDVVKDAQALRGIIGLAGQYAAVDETLTGPENLEMVGRLYHMSKKDARARATELIKEFDLEEAGDRITKNYSGGMRRRLDLAASLVIRPKVLFLDEPTTGLDPAGRFTLWQVIRNLVGNGTTVLLTTQYMEEADQLANYIFVIDHGHIIAQGTSDELKRQVGGDVLELHLKNRSDAEKASALVRQFGTETPHANTTTGVVTVPTTGGASILVDVVRQLDGAEIKLADIILRRPSLDDVFMKLTGHEAE